MKRNLVKLIAVFIVSTFLFNTTAFAADTSVVGVSPKIAENVQVKLADMSDDEKISVFCFLKIHQIRL